MSKRFVWFLLAALISSASLSRVTAAEFPELARRIPANANVLVLIDVEKTLAAPLAVKQGWAAKFDAAYVARPIFLPPEASKLALGADLNPAADFNAAWEVAVMDMAEPISVRSIARSEGGQIADLNGVATAFTPQGVAFAMIDDRVLAAIRPNERQFVSRWLSHTRRSNGSELSDYLKSALPQVNDRVQMLYAIDLTDVLSPEDVEEKLREAAWFKDSEADVAGVAKIVASLRGLTLRVAVGKEAQGQLQIDFSDDVSPLKPLAKKLVVEALGNLGFQTDELSTWDEALTEHSIRLRGDLSTDAQRRLFSVVEIPNADLNATEASPGDPKNPSESEVRERSLAYFNATQVLLKDLRKGLKNTKATSAWMERYARRIDEVPILHVDELLLDYGDKLAETLRIMSVSKRHAGVRAGVRANEGGGYYGGYDYGSDAYSRAADRSQARKEEMAGAYDTRIQGWQLIDNATADIRRTLTQKHGVEF